MQKIFAYNNTDTVKAKKPNSNRAINFAQIVSLIKDGSSKHASHQYKPIQEAAKHWYEQGDQRAKANLDLFKSNLHWLILNGFNTCGHAEKGLKTNGYIQIDVDFHTKGGHIKAEIIKALIKAKQTPFIAFCATSPTGYGLKLLVKTSIAPNYISNIIENAFYNNKPTSKIIFIGNMPVCSVITKTKKGSSWQVAQLTLETKTETIVISIDEDKANWLLVMLPKFLVSNFKTYTLQEVQKEYEAFGLDDFELFWDNKPMNTLYKAGLLCL